SLRAFLTRLGAVSRDLRAPRRERNRKGQAMITKSINDAMVLGAGFALSVAGAVMIAMASPSWAAPVLPNTAAVKTAASNQVTDVRYYRHSYHRHGYYRRGYYGGGYGYPYRANPYPYPYSYPYSYSYPSGYGWSGW